MLLALLVTHPHLACAFVIALTRYGPLVTAYRSPIPDTSTWLLCRTLGLLYAVVALVAHPVSLCCARSLKDRPAIVLSTRCVLLTDLCLMLRPIALAMALPRVVVCACLLPAQEGVSNLIPRYLRCYRGYSPGLWSDLTLGTNPIPVVTAYCIA